MFLKNLSLRFTSARMLQMWIHLANCLIMCVKQDDLLFCICMKPDPSKQEFCLRVRLFLRKIVMIIHVTINKNCTISNALILLFNPSFSVIFKYRFQNITFCMPCYKNTKTTFPLLKIQLKKVISFFFLIGDYIQGYINLGAVFHILHQVLGLCIQTLNVVSMRLGLIRQLINSISYRRQGDSSLIWKHCILKISSKEPPNEGYCWYG